MGFYLFMEPIMNIRMMRCRPPLFLRIVAQKINRNDILGKKLSVPDKEYTFVNY